MKRIAISLATLVAALTVSALATSAAWTDTVTVTDNVITTGSADLQVSTLGPGLAIPGDELSFNDSTAGSTMTLTGLVPGGASDEDYSFSLWNASTAGVDFNLTGTVSMVNYSNPIITVADEDELMLTLYDVSGGVPDVGPFSMTAWKAGVALPPALASGDVREYGFRASLTPAAGDDWQGQTITFDFDVFGSQ